MSLQSFRLLALFGVAGIALATPGHARAQARRTYLAPTFSAGGAYDDNIFFSDRPQRQGGSFLRVGPTLQAGWQPRPSFSVFGAYSFDAEVYPEYPELNDLFARQRASAGLRYRHRRTTVSLSGGFDQTHTASDLVEETGLQFGRWDARGYSGWGSLEQGLGRDTSLSLHYGYRYLNYEVEEAKGGQGGSHVLGLGWTQQLGRSTTLSVRAGPRLTDDVATADVTGHLTRRFRRSTLSLGYGRARYVTPGQYRDVESVTAAVSRPVGRSLQLSASAAVFRHWTDDADKGRGLRGGVSMARTLASWLFLVASYQHQRQSLLTAALPPGATGEWRFRNVLYAGLTLTNPRHSQHVVGTATSR